MRPEFVRAHIKLRDWLLTHAISKKLRVKLGALKYAAQDKFLTFPVLGKAVSRARITALERVPIKLNIEVTSICNAKCVMCPRHLMDREMEVMPDVLFQKIFLEAKNMGIKQFALNGYGEIFTAKKDYQKFIRTILDAMPDAKIIINTNASLMTEAVARFLIEMKVDTVHINIDGATKETFEKVRLNLHYDQVAGNVRKLIELRNSMGAIYPKVRVGIIRQPLNQHEVALFLQQWNGVADFVGDDFLVSRAGFVETQGKDIGHPCFLVWSEMSVWSDGSVVLCCDDWNVHEMMGNAKVQSLSEIWTGAKFRRARILHREGKEREIEICSKCNWSRRGPDWFQNNVRG